MGNWICKRKQPFRVIIQGMDAAGKSTLMHQLNLGTVTQTNVTIGFNLQSIDVGNISITSWGVAGRNKIRPLYRYFYSGIGAFIFVIDANDKEQLGEALSALIEYVFLDELTFGKPVLVLANKQDLPNAMTEAEVREALVGTGHSFSRHPILLRTCSISNMEGVWEALTDLVELTQKTQLGKASMGILPKATNTKSGNDILVKGGPVAWQMEIKKRFFALGDAKRQFEDHISYIKSLPYNPAYH